MRSSRSRTRGCKDVEHTSDVVEVASTGARGSKRPRQQQQSKQLQQQQQKKGGAKGKVDRHAALDEHVREINRETQTGLRTIASVAWSGPTLFPSPPAHVVYRGTFIAPPWEALFRKQGKARSPSRQVDHMEADPI